MVVATEIDTGVALEFAFAAIGEVSGQDVAVEQHQCWASGTESLGWLVVGVPFLISGSQTVCPWPLEVRFSRGGHALKNAPGHLYLYCL